MAFAGANFPSSPAADNPRETLTGTVDTNY
jgi:hypothetical protein